jgi:hypothetical protein
MGQDLRRGGAAPAPWVTASADTRPNGNRIAVTMVKLGGIINKTFATADDVRFQVVKLTPSGGRTVVWPASGVPMQMNAAQTGTFNFDTSNVQVDVQGKWVPQEATDMWGFVRREYRLDADRLVFQVLSDSPIDPRSIDWKPTVTYQSYCYPDPADQRTKVIAGQTINADTINHICTSTPANVIGGAVTQKVEVQVPAFRYQPLTPTSASPQRTQAVHLFNDTANHTFAVAGEVEVWPGPGVDPSWQPGQDRGQVVALLQGRERLIKKEVIQLGTSGEPRFVPFQISNVPINGAEPIYFTLLVTGNHEVQWSPIVAPTGQSHQIHSATVRYLVDPPLPGQATGYPFQWTEREWLSGGFHQWTFGVYNGSYNFNTAGLRTPATYLGESHPHTAFPAVPSTTGIENPPPELPGTLPPATPLWRGKAHDDYVSPMGVFHASYFGSGSGPAFPPGAAFRRSSSHTGGGGMSAGVSLEVAYGNTYGEIGIADLNGDRVPDLLGLDRVRVGRVFIDNTLGYGTGPLGGWIRPLQAEALHATYNRTSRWGIGLGSISSQMFDKPDPKGNTKSLRSSAPSFGFGYGTSRTYADLIDINGDGLTDHVIRAPGSQILNVQLGNGYENFGFFRNGLQEWPMPSLGSWDISQSPTSHFESHFSEDEDGLRVQDNDSNSLEINIMNIGGGVAFQASRTMVDMIDLNGDGLPDRVMKVPPNFVSVLPPLPGVPTGSSPLLVQWNTGLGFAAPETWVMPPWSADIENNFFTEAGLGSNDALAFNTGRTVSLTAGAVLWIPVFPIVCAIIEFGLMSTNLLNGVNAQNTQMLFQDINGDGRPDQIFKKDNLGGSPGDGVVYAKLNPIDHANLLIKVDGPLGGGFDIEYERAGNQVDIARNVDDPDNHYVMKAVTVRSQPSPGGTPRWNADPPVRTEYTYADPFYSRADRDFIGFARVTTNLPGTPDRLVVQETYDTTDVYRKGLLKKRVMRKRGSTTPASTPDDSLPVFEAEEHTWQTRQLIGPAHPIYEPRPVKFTVETNRILRSYEGSGTNPDAATVTREEIRDYENNYGNLTYFEDKGDLSTTTDDVRYTIGYHEDTTRYIFKPNSVVARNSSGAKIAQRTATYHATHGKLLTTTDLLVGGRRPSDGATYNGDAAANPTPNPVWTFTYDQLGVVQTITDPSVRPGPPASNYVISVNFTDPITRATPVTMQDSFGYVWTQEHDARTGLPTRTIDFNDVVLDRPRSGSTRPTSRWAIRSRTPISRRASSRATSTPRAARPCRWSTAGAGSSRPRRRPRWTTAAARAYPAWWCPDGSRTMRAGGWRPRGSPSSPPGRACSASPPSRLPPPSTRPRSATTCSAGGRPSTTPGAGRRRRRRTTWPRST